jgi:hypothetical protein
MDLELSPLDFVYHAWNCSYRYHSEGEYLIIHVVFLSKLPPHSLYLMVQIQFQVPIIDRVQGTIRTPDIS